MSKHTPGVVVRYDNNEREGFKVEFGIHTAVLLYPSPFKRTGSLSQVGFEESERLAHLISAAPELLVALKFLLPELRHINGNDMVRDFALKAIAKAEGNLK